MIYNGNCVDILSRFGYDNPRPDWSVIFADPPDGIGLGYNSYNDKMSKTKYCDLIDLWVNSFLFSGATCIWLSFNSRWTLEFARAINGRIRKDWEFKPCVQTFTFGQHNKHDLGDNHRPLWRLKHKNHPLFPDRIRVPSWRQLNGDKRADPRGRVPGNVQTSEIFTRETKPIPNLSPKDIERFMSKIDKRGDDECWPWTAGTKGSDATNSYGIIRIGGRAGAAYIATRVMWRLVYGSDPIGQLICHTCDNPRCCNPNHLFLGTDLDNARDKERKGRGNHPKGADNGLSKLSEEDVCNIFMSADSDKELGRKYNVTDANISSIRKRKTWGHVTEKLVCSNVFAVPRVTGNSKQRRCWHPTQLGEDLIERCILLTCPDGGRVLDPFAGTGTTLRVCKKHKIPCDLMEIDQYYCERIRQEHPEQEII